MHICFFKIDSVRFGEMGFLGKVKGEMEMDWGDLMDEMFKGVKMEGWIVVDGDWEEMVKGVNCLMVGGFWIGGINFCFCGGCLG